MSGPTSVPASSGSPMRIDAVGALQTRREHVVDDRSCTIRRRSEVQRWPAVPAAANSDRPRRRDRDRPTGATIMALLPPSSSSERPKRRGDARADRAAHARRAGGADERDAAIVDQPLADIAAADRRPPSRPSGAVAEARDARARKMRLARERGERRLLRRLPDHRVAADDGEREVPRPDRDREVERADDADRRPADARSPSCDGPAAREAMVRP